MGRSAAAARKTHVRRRGSPEHTRERLLEAAAEIFNRVGYHGTDSNQIAHEAGYATGTFYKHFADKKEIFLAVYERWVSGEWEAVSRIVEGGETPEQLARKLVKLSIEFHTGARGLRSSLHALVTSDTDVRRFYRQQRRKQLDTMAEIRKRIGAPKRTREEDAIHLYTTERVFDAIANNEVAALGLDCEEVVEEMNRRVLALLR